MGDNENIQEFNRFLKNNSELLDDKYRQYFTLAQLEMDSVAIDSVVRFISDIFSFDRYHDTETSEKIAASLRENYLTFLSHNPQITKFTSQVAINVLQFCVQNNKLFAVKYETLDKEESDNQKTYPRLVGQLHDQTKTKSQNIKSSRSESPKESEDPQSPNRSMEMRNSFELENEFDFHEQIKVKVDYDPVLIKKNIKTIFEFYCKEQMALTNNAPFERIERESSMLTLNNLLIMAQLNNFFSGTITKDVIGYKFKKISEGCHDIGFEKFDILMNQLQIIDPTLIARAQLNSPSLSKHLKSKKLPFNTKDTSSRELIRNRGFQKKLTIHSGKLEADLLEDVKKMREKSKNAHNMYERVKDYFLKEKINSPIKLAELRKSNDSIITTQKLSEKNKNLSSEIRVMKKIVSDEEDHKWLSEYEIKSPFKDKPQYGRKSVIVQQLKKRVKQLQKEDWKLSSFEETSGISKPQRPPIPPKSKYTISNIH